MKDAGVEYPILLGGMELSGLYGEKGAVPCTYAIDAEGRIAASEVGYDGPEKLEGMVVALLREKRARV